MTKRIALFASGSGTNVQNIAEYFPVESEFTKVDSVWSNNPDAYALVRADKLGIASFTFNREQFYQTDEIVEELKERKIDLVVLAGFLWLVPKNLIEEFTVINIHPALLPKYGGEGMYGMAVHEAVVDNAETETGITIHYVNEKYDDGEIIFQKKCSIPVGVSPEYVAKKVHDLEYVYFPEIIEKLLR